MMLNLTSGQCHNVNCMMPLIKSTSTRGYSPRQKPENSAPPSSDVITMKLGGSSHSSSSSLFPSKTFWGSVVGSEVLESVLGHTNHLWPFFASQWVIVSLSTDEGGRWTRLYLTNREILLSLYVRVLMNQYPILIRIHQKISNQNFWYLFKLTKVCPSWPHWPSIADHAAG